MKIEEHSACKKLSDQCNAGVIVRLEQGVSDLHVVQLMPLPPNYLI